MTDGKASAPTAPGAAPGRPRWFWLYFLLAALDVITVLVSLGLNHRLMQIYTHSVAVNQEWAARLSTYADLATLAGEVNAPGNDVFDSRNVAQERRRMQLAITKFNQAFDVARREAAALKSPEIPLLLDNFAEIEKAMKEMVQEAELIFGFFEQASADKAGERMATMDRKYASLNAALARLSRQVRAIQQALFERQIALARSLDDLEFIIAALVILMIVGAVYYGTRVMKTMIAAERDRKSVV